MGSAHPSYGQVCQLLAFVAVGHWKVFTKLQTLGKLPQLGLEVVVL